MNWKQEIDALIESTMAFARDVKRQPIPDLPVASCHENSRANASGHTESGRSARHHRANRLAVRAR